MRNERALLAEIEKAEKRLTETFRQKLEVNTDLDRTLVSYQANRSENGHRWYKYKEGFSAELMRYLFDAAGLTKGLILDPFVGSGTALFGASERGIDAVGIELLPSSSEVVEVRALLSQMAADSTAARLREFAKSHAWTTKGPAAPFPHVRITEGAFSAENETKLGRYLHEVDKLRDPDLKRVLRFAAMSVLEAISFTRKDGQYLRWDFRSGRTLGRKRFDKGTIAGFDRAVTDKINEIAADLSPADFLRQLYAPQHGRITLLSGSCLDLIPTLGDRSFDAIVTSPPYCNRYDYTRTYALELAFLGTSEAGFRHLRQEMLSCTVENRDKEDIERRIGCSAYRKGIAAFENQSLLQAILEYLDYCRESDLLNNNGIVRMVRNYFREMAVVLAALAAKLKPSGLFYMVNDNVRYQGIQVPVDLMLSDIAENVGLSVETIWVLPRGKGNSSQQMGVHGREELRKCVYVWRSKAKSATRSNRELARAA